MNAYENGLIKLQELKNVINNYQDYSEDKSLTDIAVDKYEDVRGLDKEVDQKFDDLIGEIREILPKFTELMREKHSIENDITDKFGIKKEDQTRIFDKETYVLSYIDDVLVNSTEMDITRPVLTDAKEIKTYNKIKKLQTANKVNTKKVEKLLSKNTKIGYYVKANNSFDKYEEYLQEINNLPRKEEYKAIEESYNGKMREVSNINHQYIKGLKTKKYEIATANLFIDNYKKLATSQLGSVAQFAKDANIDLPLSAFSNSLIDSVKKVEAATYLHDEWRNERFDEKTGTYAPVWKEVLDKNYNSENKKYTKIKDGKTYIDIANLPFKDLSFDCQMENYSEIEKIRNIDEYLSNLKALNKADTVSYQLRVEEHMRGMSK